MPWERTVKVKSEAAGCSLQLGSLFFFFTSIGRLLHRLVLFTYPGRQIPCASEWAVLLASQVLGEVAEGSEVYFS